MTKWPSHLLYMRHIARVCTRQALHIVHAFAIIMLRLLLSLLALVLRLVLLLHVLDVGAGIPVCWHLWYGKVPLATCTLEPEDNSTCRLPEWSPVSTQRP